MPATRSSPSSNAAHPTVPPVVVEYGCGQEYVHDLGARVLAPARRVGNVSINAYERTFTGVLDLGQGIAAAWQPAWVRHLTTAQTEFVRALGAAYFAVARETLT